MAHSDRGVVSRIIRFISQLLRSLWLFFPGLLFLILFVFCFWMLGQGKDIIIAFTENSVDIGFASFSYTRLVFFMAIGFWVYVTWYSSRIISYIKKSKQKEKVKEIAGIDDEAAEKEYQNHPTYFELNDNFLQEFPRFLGNACFLILELAVLQSPLLYHPMSSGMAWTILVVVLVLLRYVNKWIAASQAMKSSFRNTFNILLIILIVLIAVVCFLPGRVHILLLLVLLLWFHCVFIFYINLRRAKMESQTVPQETAVNKKNDSLRPRSFMIRLMDFFCIPRKESGYFKWFLFLSMLGIICYIMAIGWLYFARGIGPFPYMILAFGVLLLFGNVVAAVSVRYNVNLHFLLLLMTLIFGVKETHFVRTVKLSNRGNKYADRPKLRTYLTAWLNDRNVLGDSTRGGYDIYFVMANGGASRSGYWTAAVLGKIEDSSLINNPNNRFSDHVFCLSGTSGGGVGVASFFGLLRNKNEQVKPVYSASARDFLKSDYFTFTVARMLGPDFFNYIFHVSSVADRAAALESSFEKTSLLNPDSLYRVPFYDTLSEFPALKNGKTFLPILCVNTTRMQDGNPGVVTNLRLDSGIFNNRVDVLTLLNSNEDITLTSGAILGARFPYLSPAGRIGKSYFVDGGYFDNSGAGVVQEMIRGILNIASEDSLDHGTLYKQIRKLHFKVLHITNSPVNLDSSNIKAVAPFKNDILAPLLTMVGAYDMQTTVNDSRLINFIKDINSYSANKADYLQIPLYKDPAEWKQDSLFERFPEREPPYAMNWFMSDTTVHRINKRLQTNPKLDSLIASMRRN